MLLLLSFFLLDAAGSGSVAGAGAPPPPLLPPCCLFGVGVCLCGRGEERGVLVALTDTAELTYMYA